jgi:hypothetical protein
MGTKKIESPEQVRILIVIDLFDHMQLKPNHPILLILINLNIGALDGIINLKSLKPLQKFNSVSQDFCQSISS